METAKLTVVMCKKFCRLLYSKLGEFDIISACMVLHYAKSASELRSFIRKPSKVLKPDGLFAAMVMNPDHPEGDYAFSKARPNQPVKNGTAVHVELYNYQRKKIVEFDNYYWSREIYQNIFKEAGFSSVNWFDVVPPPTVVQKYSDYNWKEDITHPHFTVLVAQKYQTR